MGTIASVTANVKKLDLAKEAMGVVVEMKEEMLQLNKDQLADGVNKEGSDITPSYAPSTRAKKLRLGRSGKVDLLDKGDFQEAMKIKVLSKESYEVYSTNWKNAMLIKRYGKVAFFGLNRQSISELIQTGFEDNLMTRVHNVTKL